MLVIVVIILIMVNNGIIFVMGINSVKIGLVINVELKLVILKIIQVMIMVEKIVIILKVVSLKFICLICQQWIENSGYIIIVYCEWLLFKCMQLFVDYNFSYKKWYSELCY